LPFLLFFPIYVGERSHFMNQSTTQTLNSNEMLRHLATLKKKLPPKFIGATFMLLWALSFSTAMAFAKTLSSDVDSVMVLFMRYFFGLVFFSPFIVKAGTKGFVTSRPRLHLMRVPILPIGIYLWHLQRPSG
jgi:hypothetical protein